MWLQDSPSSPVWTLLSSKTTTKKQILRYNYPDHECESEATQELDGNNGASKTHEVIWIFVSHYNLA
jgi:hypothetical protein